MLPWCISRWFVLLTFEVIVHCLYFFCFKLANKIYVHEGHVEPIKETVHGGQFRSHFHMDLIECIFQLFSLIPRLVSQLWGSQLSWHGVVCISAMQVHSKDCFSWDFTIDNPKISMSLRLGEISGLLTL